MTSVVLAMRTPPPKNRSREARIEAPGHLAEEHDSMPSWGNEVSLVTFSQQAWDDFRHGALAVRKGEGKGEGVKEGEDGQGRPARRYSLAQALEPPRGSW